AFAIYSTTSIIPNQRCTLLFNVQQPFEVLMNKFDTEWWPLVTNIWVKFSSKNHINGNYWKTFVCYFNKPFKSSTYKEDVPNKKQRKTKVQEADLYFAKIKVTWFVTTQKVRVECFQDSLDHTHELEESEKLKRFQAVQVLVEKKAIKNYPAPAIVSAVKEYANEKLDLGT
ncbi:5146_t:CDS:1, partial [Gigaspora margarita]